MALKISDLGTKLKMHKPKIKSRQSLFSSCRITLYLQKEQIAESTGLGKNRVRNLAAANALFKMYEKHDVITVSPLFLRILFCISSPSPFLSTTSLWSTVA